MGIPAITNLTFPTVLEKSTDPLLLQEMGPVAILYHAPAGHLGKDPLSDSCRSDILISASKGLSLARTGAGKEDVE